MKGTGICPKCGGRDILKVKGDAGPYGTGSNIKAGLTIFSSILVDRYICCNCGYVESWINKDDISKLKKSNRIQKL